MSTPIHLLENYAQTVHAASLAIPRIAALENTLQIVQKATERGWFMPDEDEAIRLPYASYLAARTSLLEVIQNLAPQGKGDSIANKEQFLIAFAAATLVIRGTSFIVNLAKENQTLWKKLDEAEMRYGLPRKTFTTLHKAATDISHMKMYRKAATFFFIHREEIFLLENNSTFQPIVALLREDETVYQMPSSEIWQNRFFYRYFSFMRRHHSAYRKIMFTLFRWSGSAIAELHQPFVKARDEGKRITKEQRNHLLTIAQPGDVFITRHDDAVSNLFLPGFWPHAALYLGSAFLEAKKDGVKIRSIEETLAVDSLMILRPPLQDGAIQDALTRAKTHEGKGYDFVFDFRKADRLACTEVIYRTYHGHDGIEFHLIPQAGRMCIPAEELINQALANGFTLLCMCNYTDGKISTKQEAMNELAHSRL